MRSTNWKRKPPTCSRRARRSDIVTLSLSGVRKLYPRSGRSKGRETVALDRVDLEVAADELMVVVGPSGSGKTTLLRCIAGLEAIDEGDISVDGRVVSALPPAERDVAMVFQELALYPHIDVSSNISFGLRARKVTASEIDSKVSMAAEMLSLEAVLDRLPSELSGGERQRVALARALVRTPKTFLLDEPLSNLDAALRTRMRGEIRALQRRLGVATVYVTHDQVEAMTMGHRVTVLREGRVEQVGPPEELYARPATSFVASFLGSPPMNLVSGEVIGSGGPSTIGLRPEDIRLVEPGAGRLRGQVTVEDMLGPHKIVHVSVGPIDLLVTSPTAVSFAPGQDVGIDFDDGRVHRFDGSGRAIG